MEAITSAAINSVEQLVRKATDLKVVPVKDNGERCVYIEHDVDGKRQIDLFPIRPQRISHRLLCPQALFEAIKSLKPEIDDNIAPALFIHDPGLTYLFDRTDRRDYMDTLLTKSDAMEWLEEKAASGHRQKDFVRALRITFDKCLPSSELIESVKSLRWIRNAESTGSIGHGKESMGRSVDARVGVESNIPELVTLTINVFQQIDYRHPVRVAIEIEPESQEFRMTPFPGELEGAVNAALQFIGEEAASTFSTFANAGMDDIPILFGQPSFG